MRKEFCSVYIRKRQSKDCSVFSRNANFALPFALGDINILSARPNLKKEKAMKKGKLLILLLALLSIILVLVACDKTDTPVETTVGTAAGSDSETASQTAEEVSTEAEPPKGRTHQALCEM